MEMESTGSAERFPIRVEKFRKNKKFLPVIQHYGWWFLHNFITHPLIGVFPLKLFFEFHDWSSVKLNAGEASITTEIEELETIKKQLDNTLKTLVRLNKGESSSSFDIERAISSIEYDIHIYYLNKRRRK